MDLNSLSVPKSVQESAAYVMDAAEHVSINRHKLKGLVGVIEERATRGVGAVEENFGSAGRLADDANLIFFETAANFCFWGEREDAKWKVEYRGEKIGGWYGLARAFQRAVEAGKPVHDPEWMSRLSITEARELFAGVGHEIPLIEQRVNNIVEAANFLIHKYGGSTLTMLEHLDYSAPKIAEEVVRNMQSYRDGAVYKGRWVWLLKRAQILPSDLSQLSGLYPGFSIQHLDQLTAFADYRLPQVLRHHGAIAYSDELSGLIDRGAIIPAGSWKEVEIRAATIMAFEYMKEYSKLPVAQLDLGMWLLSQDIRDELMPHHHTINHFY